MREWVVGVGAALLLGACLESSVQVCENGRVCPDGTVCDDRHNLCVLPGQLGACADAELNELASCTIPGKPEGFGFCLDGDCLAHDCGDARVTGNERCDPEDGETAVTSCTGDEGLGFYQGGDVACTFECRYDETSCGEYCGDEIVNGPELCDANPPTESCVDIGFDRGFLDCSALTCAPEIGGCGFLGWRGLPTGTTQDITAMSWSGTSAFAVAGEFPSVLLQYSDRRWQRVAQVDSRFNAVWAADADTAFVVGERIDGAYTGMVHRYQAGVLTLELEVPGTQIEKITGAGDAVFVFVGDEVRHRDRDGDWTTHPMPEGYFTPEDVWARSESEAYGAASGALLRWNGVEWAVVADTPSSIKVLHGFGDDQLVVGRNDGGVWLYDGDGWSDLGLAGRDVTAVFGRASDDLYAMVDYSDQDVFHFDGAAWRRLTSGLDTSIYEWRAVGVLGPTAADLVVFGAGGSMLRYQAGHSGVVRDAPERVNDPHYFASVRDLWASGEEVFLVANPLEHFDGATWETYSLVGAAEARAVWGSDPDDVWFVGHTNTPDGTTTTMHHYDGAWPAGPAYTVEGRIVAISGSGPDDIVAVGEGGMIVTYDGDGWSETASPTEGQPELVAVSCAASGACMAVADDGTGFLRAGRASAWAATSALPTDEVRTVWWLSGTTWLVGGVYGVWSTDGTTHEELLAAGVDWIRGSAADDVFAVGGTQLFHFDGVRFSAVRFDALFEDAVYGMWVGLPVTRIIVGAYMFELVRLESWSAP